VPAADDAAIELGSGCSADRPLQVGASER